MKDEYAAHLFKVVDVLAPSRLVLNCGVQHGVGRGDRFAIYALGDMMIDPDTDEELECIILRRGTGRVLYVQSKICTIESDTPIVSPSLSSLMNPFDQLDKVHPFDSPRRGDIAAYIDPMRKSA